MLHIQNQALWLNNSATAGNHAPVRRLPRLLINVSVASGMMRRFASRVTGLNR
ncbi:MAG: hypothetical protein BWX84_01714 [Verrucomicrobia bacterium ADurb.Bin118]|nr:MAG: hypothetical protein BWX84_01714 [Verrucomicrobia bacterium ADurb.Bin118]